MKAVLSLLRPHQWLKNGFVLLGVLFSHRWSEPALVLAVGVDVVAFCLASSAVYVFNDYHDRNEDALHPVKCQRPLSCGKVPLHTARSLIVALLAAALLLPFLIGQYVALALIVAYLMLNAAYTLWLKHLVLIDVFCIVVGFMLRLACGTYAVGITASRWMLLCAFTLTLFLGFAKRRAELATLPAGGGQANGNTRGVLQHYSLPLLDTLVAITASIALLSYSLYTVDVEVAALHGTRSLILSLPVVTFGVFRYLYLLHQHGSGEDPGRDLWADNQIRLAVLVWAQLVKPMRQHACLALFINLPLFVLFCSHGEMRNLSMLFPSFLALTALTLNAWLSGSGADNSKCVANAI